MSPQTSVYDLVDPSSLRRRATAKWNRFEEDVLALWVAEMDYETAPAVHGAIQDAVDREEFGYPRLDAATGLPEATAEWSRERYGWTIDPSRVHLLPDVLKGVEIAIDLYSPPGAPVALPTPAYMPFFEVPTLVNRPIIEVPMAFERGRHVLDLDRIDAALALGAHSVILCNPYNPLGRAFTNEELEGLSLVVARHGARVVSDEIHGPLTYDTVHVPYASVSHEAAAHSITLVSASKAWNLPGLKCAQAIVSNDADEEVWQEIPALRTHGASTLGIEANIAAYRYGASWLDATLQYLDRNRRHLGALLDRLLPDVRYFVPEATYLAWLDFTELHLPVEPAEYLLEQARVAVNPGIAFGANGSGCVRLNFATSAKILEQAVSAIAAAIRARSGEPERP